jgi:S1-C subfamily serine protease
MINFNSRYYFKAIYNGVIIMYLILCSYDLQAQVESTKSSSLKVVQHSTSKQEFDQSPQSTSSKLKPKVKPKPKLISRPSTEIAPSIEQKELATDLKKEKIILLKKEIQSKLLRPNSFTLIQINSASKDTDKVSKKIENMGPKTTQANTSSDKLADKKSLEKNLLEKKNLEQKPIKANSTIIKSHALKTLQILNTKKIGIQKKLQSMKLMESPVSTNSQLNKIQVNDSCKSNLGRDFSCAFKKVIPSVLRIASGHKVGNKFIPSRVGSGIVWGKEHYIVTNAHVVERNAILRARTYERHVIKLTVIGIDKNLDLALLAPINSKDLANIPPISLAQKEALPGNWVAAIGHPYQMSYSLSTGAVSALHRNDLLDDWKGTYPGFIQTDLTLNPGNSGGPLVNIYGEMLGLNTAVLGSGQGLSFALPLSRLVPVIKELKRQGIFDRSYVGLQLRNVSYKKAQKSKISVHQAVRVHRVVSNGPAELAGLMKDDLITHVDEKSFANPEELSWYLISSPPEFPILINFIRVSDQKIHNYTAILTPAPIANFIP